MEREVMQMEGEVMQMEERREREVRVMLERGLGEMR